MEKQLNFVFDYSLEEMCLRRVVANLWTETDILVTIQNLPSRDPYFVDHRIKNHNAAFKKVKAKVSKLVIPASLKERMMDIIKPIGYELMRWKTFHVSIFKSAHEDLCFYMMKRLFWTSAGTIDYRRTAEIILGLDALGVRTRYTMACSYCLVDYIPILWNELPEWFKEDYLSDVRLTQMECYWARAMEGGESKLERTVTEPLHEDITFTQRAFEILALNGNKSAANYFLRKLPSEERKVSLLNAVDTIIVHGGPNSRRRNIDFPTEKVSEMLRYLLSLLSPAQHVQVVKDRPVEILRRFLDWPCQDLFLEAADFVFTFLSEEKYDHLLRSLLINIADSGYYFPILFRKFFADSPSEFKGYFIKYECDLYNGSSYFEEFLDAEDAETIRCVFRNVTLEHRINLCHRYNFFQFLDQLIMEGKLHLVKVCIEEISSCQKDRAGLEEIYMGYLKGVDSRRSRLRKRRWKQIFQECDEDKANGSSKRSYRGKTLKKAPYAVKRKRKF